MVTVDELYRIFLQSNAVCTDTRQIKKDALFFALKGDNFNGNEFAEKAIENGCSYAIIDEEKYVKNEKYLLVDNVLKALQELATYHRKKLNIPVIAITGSNGKTTTKELVCRVLSKRYLVYATQGNLNNHIGVPLTLLSLTKNHEIAVVEMGANHQGEIAMLSEIVLPNYGIITNVGKAHLEGFGGFEGVIKGKSELYKYIRKNNGLLFVNADDDILMKVSGGIERYTYGIDKEANIKANDVSFDSSIKFSYISSNIHHQNIKCEVCSVFSGKYNLYNILTAVALGTYFKVDENKIASAIEEYIPDNNRSQKIIIGQTEIILDAYNANPSSMKEALENFEKQNHPSKIAIIGGMNELGNESEYEHKFLIERLQKMNLNKVILAGNHFKEIAPKDFLFVNDIEEIDSNKWKQITNESLILVKGSRTNKLERIINLLRN